MGSGSQDQMWNGEHESLVVEACKKSYACTVITCPYHEDNPHRITSVGVLPAKDLTLDLDDLFAEYVGTNYDIGGEGHSITIKGENKDAAVEEMTNEFRQRIISLFEPVEDG